jgi:hypothetical protein
MSIALLLFGGFTVFLVVLPIIQRHLSPKLIAIFVGVIYTDWFIFSELRQKIKERPKAQP